MPAKSVVYMVKSMVDKEHAAEFNHWYHHRHIPMLMDLSGCVSARRFEAIESPDHFVYLAIYEFPDKDTFLKYRNSEARELLIADYRDTFGTVTDVQSSSWKQIYP